MNIQEEMIAANVMNWLSDLAVGARAAEKAMQFAPCDEGDEWRVTSTCYDRYEDGIAIHNLEALAKTIGVPISYKYFPEEEEHTIAGHKYFKLFGVTFYDIILREDMKHERK